LEGGLRPFSGRRQPSPHRAPPAAASSCALLRADSGRSRASRRRPPGSGPRRWKRADGVCATWCWSPMQRLEPTRGEPAGGRRGGPGLSARPWLPPSRRTRARGSDQVSSVRRMARRTAGWLKVDPHLAARAQGQAANAEPAADTDIRVIVSESEPSTRVVQALSGLVTGAAPSVGMEPGGLPPGCPGSASRGSSPRSPRSRRPRRSSLRSRFALSTRTPSGSTSRSPALPPADADLLPRDLRVRTDRGDCGHRPGLRCLFFPRHRQWPPSGVELRRGALPSRLPRAEPPQGHPLLQLVGRHANGR